MGKDKFPHRIGITDEQKRKLERAAALLNADDWIEVDDMGSRLIVKYAESYAKGKTSVLFCTPDLADCIQKNPDFFKALGQEGVVEWLTPFVLGKSTTRPEKGQ
jgi:hypothetical protein